MSEAAKFRQFQTWEASTTPTNGDKPHAVRANDTVEDRKANVKRAAIFVTVALLFVLANHLGHEKSGSDRTSNPDSLAGIGLTVTPEKQTGGEWTMRLRLTNSGNRAVFYPVSNGTQIPLGHIVVRKSASSDWLTLSDALTHGVSGSQEIGDKSVAWIEMPPGGWADGEFLDSVRQSGEHAYAIFIKPDRNGVPLRILSEQYQLEPK